MSSSNEYMRDYMRARRAKFPRPRLAPEDYSEVRRQIALEMWRKRNEKLVNTELEHYGDPLYCQRCGHRCTYPPHCSFCREELNRLTSLN